MFQKIGAKLMDSNTFAILFIWIKSFLESIADALWDALWEVTFDAIETAEREWDKGNLAKDKKQWVIDRAIKFVEEHQKLGWIKKQAVKIFLATVIDRVITELNDELGKDWVEQAKDAKKEMSDMVDFLD